MIKVGFDILGGDFAPQNNLEGLEMIAPHIDENTKLVLIGDQKVIEDFCEKINFSKEKYEIVHAPEIIEMGENPIKAIQTKKNSSITIGIKLLAEDKIDIFVSAGSTAGIMVGSQVFLKNLDGISRPVIGTVYENFHGRNNIFLDSGLNPEIKPEYFIQYALMGKIYMENVLKVKNPKVSLLNIGHEEHKGSQVYKTAYQLLKETKWINFDGNIEGDKFLFNDTDVIVCDGFSGNVIIKLVGSIFKLSAVDGKYSDFFRKVSYENVGGSPVFGLNKDIIIGHGKSSSSAIKNMVLTGIKTANIQLSQKLASHLKEFI